MATEKIGMTGIAFRKLGVVIGLALFSVVVQAQSFPTRPVRFILQFPAGLGPDVVMRDVAEKLTKQWGQPVIVDNKPGASGIIALDAARRGSPDGHDIVCADMGALAVNRAIYKTVPYNVERDFEPVISVFNAPYFVIVNASLPVKTLKDFIEYAKANTGKLSYGSIGLGNPTHLSAEAFKQAYGLDMTHVPFKEIGSLVVAGGSGDISMMTLSTVSAAAGLQTGRLKVLAVGTRKRLGSYPDIPTIEEAGGTFVEAGAWVGCLAVKGTPPQVIAKINRDMDAIVKSTDFQKRLFTMGFQATGGTPADLTKLIKSDGERLGGLVQKLNIKLD
ncbi:MAG: tripartite tricarboxylate transporter substrate binding protein [Pseudomonadota bacterium]